MYKKFSKKISKEDRIQIVVFTASFCFNGKKNFTASGKKVIFFLIIVHDTLFKKKCIKRDIAGAHANSCIDIDHKW